MLRLLEAGASPAVTTVTGDTAVSMGEGRISDEALEVLKEATNRWVKSNGGEEGEDFRNSEDAQLAQQEVGFIDRGDFFLFFFMPSSPKISTGASQHIRHCKHCQARLREQLPYRRNEERERLIEERSREIEQRVDQALEAGGDVLADALLNEAEILSAVEGRDVEPSNLGIEGLVLGAEEEEERVYLPLELAMRTLVERKGGDAVLRLLEACGNERMGRRLAAHSSDGVTTQDKMKYLTGTSFVGAIVAALVRTTRMNPEAVEEVGRHTPFAKCEHACACCHGISPCQRGSLQ